MSITIKHKTMNSPTSESNDDKWPILVGDMPADESQIDSFMRLVDAVESLLTHSKGGMTVCLNGNWGTGKSTFIRLLENRISPKRLPLEQPTLEQPPSEQPPSEPANQGWFARSYVGALAQRFAAWTWQSPAKAVPDKVPDISTELTTAPTESAGTPIGAAATPIDSAAAPIESAGAAIKSSDTSTKSPDAPAEPCSAPLDSHVFVYDTWAHSGDPLRRAFLLDFLSSIRERPTSAKTKWLVEWSRFRRVRTLWEWVPGVEREDRAAQRRWDEMKEEISGRRRVVEKRSTVRVNFPGRVVLMVAILWSVRGWLVKSPTLQFLTLTPPETIHRYLDVAAWFALPLLCLLILIPGCLSSVLANKGITSENVSTNAEPEPTSIEFAEYFRTITAAALEGHPHRRLIIVLDNLDRLDAQERESAWAFLRSFVDNSRIASAPWYPQMWIIVPWADPVVENTVEAATGVGDKDRAPSKTKLDAGLADKLFQLRIDIPPPTLFSWEDSLRKRLAAGLRGRLAYEDSIVLLFALWCGGDVDVSMRRIVRFVNDLVVLDYQWRDLRNDLPLIPLDVLAAYLTAGGRDGVLAAFHAGTSFDDMQELIDLVGSGSRKHNDGTEADDGMTLSKQFAKIRYGVPEAGVEMNHALEPAWKKALQSNSTEDALRLLRYQSSINALQRLAPRFATLIESDMGRKRAFHVLAELRTLSQQASAHEFIKLLCRPENWRLIVSGVQEVMRQYQPYPNDERTLAQMYSDYFVIVEGSVDSGEGGAEAAGFDALRSLARYSSSSSQADPETMEQFAGLMLLPAFYRMARKAKTYELPFKAGDYWAFCEALGTVAIDERNQSVESLYDDGYGEWTLHQDSRSIFENLPDRPVTEKFYRMLPIMLRAVQPKQLIEVFRSFLYVSARIYDDADTTTALRQDREYAMRYFLGTLAQRKQMDVCLAEASRKELFFRFVEEDYGNMLFDVHMNIFVLLLASTSESAWSDILATSDSSSGTGKRNGKQYFAAILTDPQIATGYIEQLKSASDGLATIVDRTIYDIPAGNLDSLTYWRRVGAALREALANYPERHAFGDWQD